MNKTLGNGQDGFPIASVDVVHMLGAFLELKTSFICTIYLLKLRFKFSCKNLHSPAFAVFQEFFRNAFYNRISYHGLYAGRIICQERLLFIICYK